MIQSGIQDFSALCRTPSVSEQLGSLEANRSNALRMFWMVLAGGIVVAAAAAYILQASGFPGIAFVAAPILFFVAIAIAWTPLAKAGTSLKQPVLEALAAANGMEYFASGFAPPLYPEAKKALFGSWLSSESFTDLFNGKDENGRGVAIYEAHLQRSSGKSRHTIFQGQIYALERSRAGSAVTVIVPDRGLFNFFKPAGGMGRVRIDGDPEFEKRFEVYSTDEIGAKQLLFDSALRRRLLDLASGGRRTRVLAWFGPEGALVAAGARTSSSPGACSARRAARSASG